MCGPLARRVIAVVIAIPLTLCTCMMLGLWYTSIPRAVPDPPDGARHENYYQSSGSGGSIDFNHYTIDRSLAAVEAYYQAVLPRYCPTVPVDFSDEGVNRSLSCELPARLSHGQSFSVYLEPVSATQTRIMTMNGWEAP
jgi:hypothetical protein